MKGTDFVPITPPDPDDAGKLFSVLSNLASWRGKVPERRNSHPSPTVSGWRTPSPLWQSAPVQSKIKPNEVGVVEAGELATCPWHPLEFFLILIYYIKCILLCLFVVHRPCCATR